MINIAELCSLINDNIWTPPQKKTTSLLWSLKCLPEGLPNNEDSFTVLSQNESQT